MQGISARLCTRIGRALVSPCRNLHFKVPKYPTNNHINHCASPSKLLQEHMPRHRRVFYLNWRTFSKKTEDKDVQELLDTLPKTFHDDPEIKDWMKHLKKDFSVEENQSETSDETDDDILKESDHTTEEYEEPHYTDAGMDHLQRTAVSDADIDKQLARYDYEEVDTEYDDEDERDKELLLPIGLDRGVGGVFDAEELVTLLRDENAVGICVIAVPPEYNYVDYMVLASGKSRRHLLAMAELVKWVYKRKRGPKDPQSVRIEGQKEDDWLALDLGNVALHLMEPNLRRQYDLETLWTVGAQFEQEISEKLEDEGEDETDWENLLKEAQIEAQEKKVEARNRHRTIQNER